VAVGLVVGLLLGAGAAYEVALPGIGRITTATSVATTTETLPAVTSTTTLVTTEIPSVSYVSSALCTGNPQGDSAAAPGTWTYAFDLSVNYNGPWSLSYQGYNSLGKSNPTNATGSCDGTGSYGLQVTVAGSNKNALTLCAKAQKLDGSNSTLTLTVTGHNETSLPYGSVSYCGGVVP
jgi:hypothetical protein